MNKYVPSGYMRSTIMINNAVSCDKLLDLTKIVFKISFRGILLHYICELRIKLKIIIYIKSIAFWLIIQLR